MKMTAEDFEVYCQKHTAKEAANMLLEYVNKDQPESFLPGYTSRAMCSIAAECFKGRCGGNFDYMDFYEYMWGNGNNAMDETRAESRRNRHIRCGIQLDEH